MDVLVHHILHSSQDLQQRTAGFFNQLTVGVPPTSEEETAWTKISGDENFVKKIFQEMFQDGKFLLLEKKCKTQTQTVRENVVLALVKFLAKT